MDDTAQANQAFGRLTTGIHVAGYTLERAFQELESLLEADRWKLIGDGFDNVSKFIASIKLDTLTAAAAERKKMVAKIKALQPDTSNRSIAKMLGVNPSTIDEDVAGKPAVAKKNSKETKASEKIAAGNPAPPEISGAQAAKIVDRRTTDIATTQARRADKEQRLGAKIAALPDAKFGVILADPEWHDEVYSEQTGMNRHASRVYPDART